MKKIIALLFAVMLLLCGCNPTLDSSSIIESSLDNEESVLPKDDSENSSETEQESSETSDNEQSTDAPCDPMNAAVKYGDTVHLIYYKSPICEKEDDEVFEYSGSAVLRIDVIDSRLIESTGVFPEELIDELAKKLIGRTRDYGCLECSNESYKYAFYVNMVNMTVEPSFVIPKDWDYTLGSETGSFKHIDEDCGTPEESAGGNIFGYDDRLTQTCSAWCGCMGFVCYARASSTLEKQGETSYYATHLLEYNRKNVWAEGVEGYGIGESIEILQLYRGSGDAELSFYSICIVNGNAKSEKEWRENGRVKSLKLYYEGEYMGLITLEDTMNPQYIDISELQMKVGNGFEANFKFEIAEVYEGSKYEDTCLTGIVIDFTGIYAH